MVAFRYPDGAEHCLLVLVDHLLGGIARDATILDAPLGEVLGMWDGPEFDLVEEGIADVRRSDSAMGLFLLHWVSRRLTARDVVLQRATEVLAAWAPWGRGTLRLAAEAPGRRGAGNDR